jgi:4-hydroxybenzoate polyprenyltransferase
MRILSLLRSLYISGRPIHSGIAGFAAAVTIAFLPSATWSTVLPAACAMCCVTMAGFIVNDVYDKPKDALAFVQRPITIGVISAREAIIASGILFTVALCVTPIHERSITILLVTAVSVVVYSAFACRFPVLKGVYTAILCCAPLFYGAALGGGQFSNAVYLALVIFVTGREIYLDIRDLDGDSRFGLRTVPVLIGISAAQRLAVVLMAAGGVFMLILVRSTVGYLAAAFSLALLALILAWPGIELHRRLQLTRIPMLLGSFALASTVWSGR